MEKRLIGQTAKEFIYGGNAIFTLQGKSSRYTYSVRRGKGENAPLFVRVLTGPENTRDYSYMGILRNDGQIITTQGSRIGHTAASYKALAWSLKNLDNENLSVYHHGRCGRCGRMLTVPESIESGFGPKCSGR